MAHSSASFELQLSLLFNLLPQRGTKVPAPSQTYEEEGPLKHHEVSLEPNPTYISIHEGRDIRRSTRESTAVVLPLVRDGPSPAIDNLRMREGRKPNI